MRPRVIRTRSNWCRITREADGAFVFYVGARGEREPYRAFKYPHEELPTVVDAVSLGVVLANAPPILDVVSVPTDAADRVIDHEGRPPVLARVASYPVVRGAYQVPVRDREAVRALLRVLERHVGAHVDPFHEAEAVNLAARLHRALGAV